MVSGKSSLGDVSLLLRLDLARFSDVELTLAILEARSTSYSESEGSGFEF